MKPFRAVTIIPARGGSQGLIRKNVLQFAGKPLLAHSIQQSLDCPLIQQTYVSTDDEEIAGIAKAHGAGIIRRPPTLSGPKASSENALLHALDEIACEPVDEPDYIVFLQCTSPLRTPEDITNSLTILHRQNKDSLLSVCPNHRFFWRDDDREFMPLNYDYRLRPMRQQMANQFVENGSIYIFKPDVLCHHDNRLGGEIAYFVMQSWQSFEIDDLDDFMLCEWLYKRYLSEPIVERPHKPKPRHWEA